MNDLVFQGVDGIGYQQPRSRSMENENHAHRANCRRKKYVKAIGLLMEMGGIFRTKPIRQLVVGPGQLQVLQAAGLVTKGNGAQKHGKKQT